MTARVLRYERVPDESWLTQERISAYFVALSLQPELQHAPAVVRSAAVDKVIAGQRQSLRHESELDARALNECVALMRHDAAAAAERLARGGW